MHDTALNFGRQFFETYVKENANLTIVDVGSQDVNGSLRSVAPRGNQYIGVDFQMARGVDVVLDDPYTLPFADQSVDVCVSTSCLEHSEFFWLLFQEVLRTLKPTGLFYLNAPSNGSFHRYPVDCWRFYPDSGIALQKWGRRVGYDCALLESFVGRQGSDEWNDFVAVFVKDRAHAAAFPHRILSRGVEYTNGLVLEKGLNIANFSGPTQDQHAQLRLRELLKLRSA